MGSAICGKSFSVVFKPCLAWWRPAFRRRRFFGSTNGHFIQMRLGKERFVFIFRIRRPPTRFAAPRRLGAADFSVFDASIARQWIICHQQFCLLQALDFIAQAGRFFKIKIGCCITHVFFQSLKMSLEVVANQRAFVLIKPRIHSHMIGLIDTAQDIADVLFDRLRCDAIGLVIRHLFFAAAVGLGNGPLHGAGNLICIKDYFAVDIARGAANGLNQTRLGPQKTLFIRIQNCHHATFRNIQSFTQQVNSNEHIERAEP